MATIYTRASKGSALTWAEGDANITNLNNAKIENVVEDTTPQLGGDLDVNGKNIVSTSNGNINLQPNGTGKVVADKELEATLLRSTQSAGDEGGQINLALAATNTTLSGEVAIDVNQNRLRIFETGGSNRGVYIDLSSASTGVGTNLVSGGGATTLDGLTDVAAPSPTSGEILQFDGTNWVDVPLSGLTVGTADVGSTVTLTADNATNATNYPLFANAATGNLSPRTDTGFTYNPSTGILTATLFNGALSGNATTATTATGATNINISTINGNSNDTTLYPVMVGASGTGNQLPHIDSAGLAFNATTNSLTLGSTGATNAASLVLFSSNDGSHTISAGATANTLTLTLPQTAGSSGNILQTNGSGTLSWSSSFSGTVTGNTSGTHSGAVNTTNLAILNSTSTSNPKLTIGSSALSSGAWTTSGIGIRVQAATYTDTTSLAGTVAQSHVHGIAASTIASTNIITVTDAASLYIGGPPTAGTNTTISNGWALMANGRIRATAIDNTPIGSTTASTGAFTTLSASSTVSGTGFSNYLASPPAIGGTTAAAGTFTNLTSTGFLSIKDLRETVFTGGATTGTITPDVANGTVQRITLTGNITFNAFANPVTGQSLTLIITQSASGNNTLTSTMKFSGGSKTLSTAANAVDILTVFFDGTNYWASLAKGFA